jgi:hypothetical protein
MCLVYRLMKEDTWVRGGMAPFIPTLGLDGSEWLISRPYRFEVRGGMPETPPRNSV